MAPTKNVNRSPQKAAKKRLSKCNPVKAPLKTPTCIKVKNASISSKPPKIERKVTRQRKIELANEVALEQLTSLTKPKVTLSPTTPAPIKIETKATEVNKKSALQLKRKLPVKIQDTDQTQSKKTDKQECNPKRGRKPTLKTAETSQLRSSTIFNVQSDSEPESWQVITKRSGPKSKTINLPIAALPETAEAKSETTVTSVKKIDKTAKAKNAPARTRQQKVTDYFADPADSDETPKTVVRRTKKKQTPKKTVIKDTKTNEAQQPKERRRSKFVTERENTKVTRSKGKVLKMTDIKSAASMLDKALKGPANVKKRSSSVNSTNSNLSWTRDISTASSLSETTTCVTVCSTDFVRFDKKLPFVQIENYVEQLKLQNGTDKLLEDSSTSDSDSKSSESSTDSELDVSNKPELNLSSSSLTAQSPQYEGNSDNTELLYLEMDKLTNSLKNFYAEMGKWLDFDDDTDTFSSILDAMNLEKDIINNCDNFNSILDNVFAQTSSEKHPESNDVEEEIKSDDHRLDEESDQNREKFPINIPTNDSPEKSTKSDSSETFTSDNYNYMSFDKKICDDEDALSLFAESITGMESSRISSVSNTSVQEHIAKPIQRLQNFHETYVPKPTRPWLYERYNYLPTRIEKESKRTEDVPLKTLEPNMVEKQNADSSSIKENDLSKKAINLLDDANKLAERAKVSIQNTEEVNKPRRIFYRYHAVSRIKSALYRGYCFFFNAWQCKNNNCRFPHVDIETGVLNCRLALLTDDSLIEEYLLMLKYNNLKQKFGLLFMKECARRNATRILLEMAIDLGMGVVDRGNNVSYVDALETTLLHLNSTNFDACEDLLTFEYNNTMLCEALLRCMAYSQNFSQFKQVFVKLSLYMEQIKRSVDIALVENILERVCILPCEESIAGAMLSLMKNTDAKIFENNMTESFEFQLCNTNSNVYEQYLLAKKEAMEALIKLEQDATTSKSPVPRVDREGPRHPSPDTTNLDSLKKAQMVQTTFKRTIDTDALRHLFKSPANPVPKRRYRPEMQWRNGTGFMQPPTRLVNRRIYMNQTNYKNGANT